MYKNNKGVTLIELLVVISIITILSVLTVIGVEAVRRERVSQVSRELYADLTNMRLSAMTRSPAGSNTMGYGIRVVDQTSYAVFRFNDADNDSQYDAGEEADTETKTLPNSIALEINTDLGTVAPNNHVLIFDRYGYNRGPAWGFLRMTIAVKHVTDGSIQQKCVAVSPNRIREGFWDGANCTVQ